MHLYRRWIGVALVAASCCGACGHTPFTKTVRERHQLSDQHLRHIQFYNSESIVLERQLPVQKRKVVDSELEIRDEVRVERVVIRKGTPGVAVRIEGDHILVSFTRNAPQKSLWFTLDDKSGRYMLSHLQLPYDGKPFVERYSPGFQVQYDGKEYAVVDDESWKAFLTYDQAHSFEDEEATERPKGWDLKAR